jgi:hypothetical protein
VTARDRASAEDSQDISELGSKIEAILRQVAAMRAVSSVDDQLTQLIRLVDSGAWTAPVPMTILVDGTLVRGLLVPGEVSATFLDDALRQSAQSAVDRLQSALAHADESGAEELFAAKKINDSLQRAQTFLRRVGRKPFSILQAGIRRRNANALVAINDWHEEREHDSRLTPLEFPGSYLDSESPVRDVLAYAVGQRTLTLANVKMLIAGEWIAFPAPMRVSLGRVGAWSADT